MGRKSRSKKNQQSEFHFPHQREQIASQGVDGPASNSASQVRSPYGKLAVCGFLLLTVFAVFGRTAGYDFVNFDDNVYVYGNPHVQGGLTGEDLAWAITARHASNWHPLTWLSHMLDCELYGLEPGGHHLTNVFLHAATAILLFLTWQRMTGAFWASAWVAAVFAIHPLRVESVAWVAERKDVLSGLFFMLTLWFYARYVERPTSWGRYVSVAASFAIGLTAKPMLVTLPFVLLLLDYWPLRRLGFGCGVEGEASPPQHRLTLRRLLVEKIPLFALSAASCAITLLAQRHAMESLEHLDFPSRVANAAVAYVSYLGKMIYPSGLAVLYPFSKERPAWEAFAAVVVLLTISTACFVTRRKRPYLLVGWFWYLGMLTPVIGLVQVGVQAMADRYTYLTQIGLYAAIAWGGMDLARLWPGLGRGLAVVSAIVVAGLIACAWQQTRHWHDSITLWSHTLATTSENSTAHYNLAQALTHRGQEDEAYNHYRKSLKIKPDFAEAHYGIGNALAVRGRLSEAVAHYRTALKIKPDDAEILTNLANALAGQGQVDEAIAHYRKALEIKPSLLEAHMNLGLQLAYRDQVDEAIAHYRKALEIRHDLLEAHINLAGALARRGSRDEALAHYEQALRLASARNDWALANSIRERIKLLR